MLSHSNNSTNYKYSSTVFDFFLQLSQTLCFKKVFFLIFFIRESLSHEIFPKWPFAKVYLAKVSTNKAL